MSPDSSNPDRLAEQAVAPVAERLELASPIDLKRLVDLAAKRTGVRIEYDAAAAAGPASCHRFKPLWD